ncbi:MAG: DUF2971 domain-containing protein [Rhizobacter sp.]|nr:DUF2971 domain-containing protein [Ferruginibacter sp.]
MRPKVFKDFSEVEDDIRKNAPPVVYKYRSWDDKFHKGLLKNKVVWFSHPFDLNDPLDVRPEAIFDNSEFYDDRYFKKMLLGADSIFPEMSKHQRFLKAKAQWEEIKANPGIVIQNMKNWNSNRNNFDRIGVFSTCSSGTNIKMWEEYGNFHKGFCIGFKTVEFCRKINSGFGIVKYDDTPYMHSFLAELDIDYDEVHKLDPLYTKKKIWVHEQEFRFITVGIGEDVNRLQSFDKESVEEIIIGNEINGEDQRMIMKNIEENYPPNLPIYKIDKNNLHCLGRIRIR